MKFKVGQKVRIKNMSEIDPEYRGRIAKIVGIDTNLLYSYSLQFSGEDWIRTAKEEYLEKLGCKHNKKNA
jgi:hypothetical protein